VKWGPNSSLNHNFTVLESIPPQTTSESGPQLVEREIIEILGFWREMQGILVTPPIIG